MGRPHEQSRDAAEIAAFREAIKHRDDPIWLAENSPLVEHPLVRRAVADGYGRGPWPGGVVLAEFTLRALNRVGRRAPLVAPGQLAAILGQHPEWSQRQAAVAMGFDPAAVCRLLSRVSDGVSQQFAVWASGPAWGEAAAQ